MKNSFYFVAFRTLLLLTVLTVVWGERDINYNWNNVFPPCIANVSACWKRAYIIIY